MLLKSIHLFIQGLLVLGLNVLGLMPSVLADQPNVIAKTESVELIGQLEDVGRDLRHHTERLTALSEATKATGWTHTHHLTEIRALVHDGLRPALVRLTEIQPRLPAWQQDTVGKLLESGKMLDVEARSAFLWDSNVTQNPRSAEDKEVFSKMAEHAETLVLRSEAAGNQIAKYGIVLQVLLGGGKL